MKQIKSTILSLSLFIIAPVHAEEEVFELNVGENSGSSIFGIEFDPEVHLNLTGLLESDTPVSDLATNEHDPSRDYQIHPMCCGNNKTSHPFDLISYLKMEMIRYPLLQITNHNKLLYLP